MEQVEWGCGQNVWPTSGQIFKNIKESIHKSQRSKLFDKMSCNISVPNELACSAGQCMQAYFGCASACFRIT